MKRVIELSLAGVLGAALVTALLAYAQSGEEPSGLYACAAFPVPAAQLVAHGGRAGLEQWKTAPTASVAIPANFTPVGVIQRDPQDPSWLAKSDTPKPLAPPPAYVVACTR